MLAGKVAWISFHSSPAASPQALPASASLRSTFGIFLGQWGTGVTWLIQLVGHAWL